MDSELPVVFLSYVNEDRAIVGKLCEGLTEYCIAVWLDRDRLKPGQPWKRAIRHAIEDGARFVACFSDAYANRSTTYMNEELAVALDYRRLHSADSDLFIPVLLSGAVPDLDVRSGLNLRDLQYVDMRDPTSPNWESELARLVDAIQPGATKRTVDSLLWERPSNWLWSFPACDGLPADTYLGELVLRRAAELQAECRDRVTGVWSDIGGPARAVLLRLAEDGCISAYGESTPSTSNRHFPELLDANMILYLPRSSLQLGFYFASATIRTMSGSGASCGYT